MRAGWPIALALLLAGCAHPAAPPARPFAHAGVGPDPRIPPFAVQYQPLTRAAVVAIALREWRLFGMPVDDDPPGTRPEPLPDQKPERQEGLWQRVGEYWWLGLPESAPEAAWTGKHDSSGMVFPAPADGEYAWSAAFVSYVMRMAGAGDRFPYSATHATYIDAAARRDPGLAIAAERPDGYAPVPGDLICHARGRSAGLRFDNLPAGFFLGHCDVVVRADPGQLSVVGGNVDDAVTMKHVPVTAAGRLADDGGRVLDGRYPWMVVLRLVVSVPLATSDFIVMAAR